MDETRNKQKFRARAGVAALCLAFLGNAAMAENLPSLGSDEPEFKVDVGYENHIVRRENVGLAKFRNTMQAEFDRRLQDGWAMHGILRGSWDGVYRMNSTEYGRKAGGPISSEATLGGSVVTAPWGDGNPLATQGTFGGVLGFPGTYPSSNPNDGMRVLGDRWHGSDGGVAFGVPVRPCDTDRRGCKDFGGYGNQKLSELEAPEFNNRLDFLREIYAKKFYSLDGGQGLFLKLGKQQVIWGRTDLFRVLDVINPVDYSRNNIYDELQDIRIPMWIAQAEYRMGASESMQDRNLQLVWNVDKFRANNLGQCGTPNVILDAGCFFRGMANLWDNGGTVANFANLLPNTYWATNFGPHQIGIANVDLPNWSLKNTQVGLKFEGVTTGGIAFSLNALSYRSQLPALHGGKRAVNSFTGEYRDAWPYLISFDVAFPRVKLVGGSMDFQISSLGAAVSLEGALTSGEQFANTNRPELYSTNKVWRSVIRVDRPTFIPFINDAQAALISGQIFYQHIFDHESMGGPLGSVGMPDWKDNFIGTLLIKGWMKNGAVSPQVILARDFRAQAYAVAPQLEWSMTNDLKLTFGANYKGANGNSQYRYDDCRSCNPFPPATAGLYPGDPMAAYSRGLSGLEPLGRFRAGPIGTAFQENDIYFKVNYKF